MTKAGEILRVEEGGFARLYPAEMSEEERNLSALVRGETNRRILQALLGNDHVSTKQLSDLAGLAKSTLSEHLADLVQSGIVNAHQGGENRISYTLQQPEKVQLLLSQHQNFVREAANRFSDLWDF